MVNGHHHVVPVKVYALIFMALMVGTAITVGAAIIHLPEPQISLLGATVRLPLTVMLALAIAGIKATLVVLYFMHLRYSHRLNWIFAVASVLWLMLLIGVTMADVLARLVE
jgi:cytochrome c oxidase subunit 4